MARLSIPLPWIAQENIDLTDTKCGCGIAQCEPCCAHLPAIRKGACARLEIVAA
jgi:aerobic-type carbon monoxide dehydrogenase small subunit (CoxS/CutS family)